MQHINSEKVIGEILFVASAEIQSFKRSLPLEKSIYLRCSLFWDVLHF